MLLPLAMMQLLEISLALWDNYRRETPATWTTTSSVKVDNAWRWPTWEPPTADLRHGYHNHRSRLSHCRTELPGVSRSRSSPCPSCRYQVYSLTSGVASDSCPPLPGPTLSTVLKSSSKSDHAGNKSILSRGLALKPTLALPALPSSASRIPAMFVDLPGSCGCALSTGCTCRGGRRRT